MNKKKIIIISIVSILAIILLILTINKKDTFKAKLISYITNKNYILDNDSRYMDKNNISTACTENTPFDCNNSLYFFDIDNYEYYMEKTIKKDGVLFNINPSYNLKNDEIIYHYSSTYNNGILKYTGVYTKENFTCYPQYEYGIDIDKSSICNYIKQEIDQFYKTASTFITDKYLLDKIKE